MPPIQTIASPRRNRISVAVPKEYGSYSFQVILVPLVPEREAVTVHHPRRARRPSFVDALLSCPKLAEGEELDISRDHTDMGREIDL